MTTYLYPQNLKATANLWLWGLRDFAILCIATLLSVLALVQLGFFVPAAVTLCFGLSRHMASSSSPCLPVMVHPAGMGVCSLWLRKRNNQSTIGRFASGKAAFSDPLAGAKRRQGGKKCSNENPRC